MTSTHATSAALIVSATLLVVACESDDPNVTGGATGDFTGSDGSTTGGTTDGGGTGAEPDGSTDEDEETGTPVDDADGGSPRDASPEDTASDDDGDGAAGRKGRIILSQASSTTQGNTTWTTTGQGIVGVEELRSSEGSCTTESEGGCTLRTCPDDTVETPTGGVSAGDIDVSGGRTDFTLEYDASEGGRYAGSTLSRTWDGSQTVTVEASGAEAPGFSAELQPPSAVEVEEPDPTGQGGNPLEVDLATGLDVEWDSTGVDGGTFFVYVASGDNTESTKLRCRWDATAGSKSVPDSLLDEMVRGEGRYYMRVQDSETVVAGDYETTVLGVEFVRDADRHTANGQIDLQ